jgi:hypothetical protein
MTKETNKPNANVAEDKPRKATPKKRAMLEALEKSLGIVTTAARIAEVDRTSHYRWLEEDPEYKEAVRLIGEQTIDFAESHLHKLIKSENPAAVIFFLKTKGKARGYVERQEIQVEESRPLSWFKE